MADASLTIIIVSYNVRSDLQACLASVYGSTFDGPLQVIVVDNVSRDGTDEMVRGEFPQVEWIGNEENVGFPKANNQALPLARGTFTLYLNPDTVVAPDTLRRCVGYLTDHPDVGLLGCKVLLPSGHIQHECARNFPTLEARLWEALYLHMLFPRHRRFGHTLMGYWDHEGSREVPCLLGAFMIGPTALLRQLKGMDESVFMFMEDLDLCYRVHEAGRKVFYLADVSILHKVGQSQKRYTGSLAATNAEAIYAFFRKHEGIGHARVVRGIFLLQGVFRLVVSFVLLPVGYAVPRVRPWLRGAWIPAGHWYLIQWALGRRS
ncbi:MAG TPA: glycosyltransferase family 2 protein [Vicinamibacterales bacterium]|nr:glycosyltransferase family 2 protein [Vicinamibacterales bacterium]